MNLGHGDLAVVVGEEEPVMGRRDLELCVSRLKNKTKLCASHENRSHS